MGIAHSTSAPGVLPGMAAPTASMGISEVESRVWPTDSVLSVLRQTLALRLHGMLGELAGADALESAGVTPDKVFCALERPKRPDHGLWALPCPQVRLPSGPYASPVALAKALAGAFQPDATFTGASAAGPFLNFTVSPSVIVSGAVREALARGDAYGTNGLGGKRVVVLDYSSPNIAKPFHAGHLRSTIIGNFVRHVLAANGYAPYSLNYLGDWGKQYGLLAVGFARYGSEEALAADPIRHLFDVYVRVNRDLYAEKAAAAVSNTSAPAAGAESVPAGADKPAAAGEDALQVDDEIDLGDDAPKVAETSGTDAAARAYFCRMERGDAEALALWRRFRELSIAKYKQIYARLNVSFDAYSGESCFEEEMKAVVAEMRSLGVLEESQGAQVVDLSAEGLGKALILKRDGASIYLTRDVASVVWRFEDFRHPGTGGRAERAIYCVGAAQEHHFRQLAGVMRRMGRPWAGEIVHVAFGMVLGMSTRSGRVVFLEDVLDDARAVMHGVMRANADKYAQVADPEAVADVLAVSALVVQDMSARRLKDYEFRLEAVTRFEGATGPYLQYAHARLCSIERKASAASSDVDALAASLAGVSVSGDSACPVTVDSVAALLPEPEALELALAIAAFPDVVQEARLSLEPCNVVSYLFLLARAVSAAVDRLWVSGQPRDVAAARLALYRAARVALGNGLRLLGLVPLERM